MAGFVNTGDAYVPVVPERLLMASGPSNVPEPVLAALSLPTIGHMDPHFLELADGVNARLRSTFRTDNRATFPVSGTGSAGMEAMLVNFLEPGDRLVVGVCGVFGERIVEAGQRLGLHVTRVDAEPGRPVPLEDLERALTPGAAAVAIVHGETSTGVAQPLDGLADAAHARDALLLVDCVTSLAGHPLSVDDSGIDVAFSGTQKCLNAPPGLAPMTFSTRAAARLQRRARPVASWCFDLNAILSYWGTGTRLYHHTPPINAIYALDAAIAIVLAEGLEQRWMRHHTASTALLAGLAAYGLEPLVEPAFRLWPLTTVAVPPGVDEAAVRRQMLEAENIEIAAGLGPLAGQVWRIGTMGVNAARGPVEEVIAALGRSLGASAGTIDDAVSAVARSWDGVTTRDEPVEAWQGAR